MLDNALAPGGRSCRWFNWRFGATEEMTDSSSPATAFAVHVKLIIANCNENGAPDEVRFVGGQTPIPTKGSHKDHADRAPALTCFIFRFLRRPPEES